MKEDIKQAYDTIAEQYAEATEQDMPDNHLYMLNKFQEELGDSTRVLDAGCGSSPMSPIEDISVFGLDFSAEQLRMCQSELVPLIQGDMARLPFNRSMFGGIIAMYSVIHIPSEERE